MAKTAQENKETTEVKETVAESAAPETVTVSKEEFEALKTQMALMAQKLTAEDRQKTRAERRLETEEKELEAIKEGNEKGEELVDYYVDLGSLRSNKNIEVSINGEQYVVPRGVPVKIPQKVVDVIENAKAQKEAAYKLQEKRRAEAERAAAKGFI